MTGERLHLGCHLACLEQSWLKGQKSKSPGLCPLARPAPDEAAGLLGPATSILPLEEALTPLG